MLTLSQNLLEISSFILHTSSDMCLLVNWQKSLLSFYGYISIFCIYICIFGTDNVFSFVGLLICFSATFLIFALLVANLPFCINKVHLIWVEQHSHAEPATLVAPHWFLEQAGNTGVHITRSNSPYLSLVAYAICGIMNGMSTNCVQNVDELKKRLLVVWYSMKYMIDSALITGTAFHKVV